MIHDIRVTNDKSIITIEVRRMEWTKTPGMLGYNVTDWEKIASFGLTDENGKRVSVSMLYQKEVSK